MKYKLIKPLPFFKVGEILIRHSDENWTALEEDGEEVDLAGDIEEYLNRVLDESPEEFDIWFQPLPSIWQPIEEEEKIVFPEGSYTDTKVTAWAQQVTDQVNSLTQRVKVLEERE